MDAIIIGHGPSLLERREGVRIDLHTFVIRQKRCWDLMKVPQVYGTKTTAICGSWTIRKQLKQVPAHFYWAFLDSRHGEVTEDELDKAADQGFETRRTLCDHWNERYRQMRTPFEMWPQSERKATSDDLGHTHMSGGLHTLLYTCELLKPKRIILAGYDNVRTGTFTWSLARGPEWNQYPDHRWDIENKMVPIIASEYGIEITYL